MTLLVRNLQKAVQFNMKVFQRDVGFVREVLAVTEYSVSVTCITNQAMREINYQYRNIDSPTDILSFPFHEVGKQH